MTLQTSTMLTVVEAAEIIESMEGLLGSLRCAQLVGWTGDEDDTAESSTLSNRTAARTQTKSNKTKSRRVVLGSGAGCYRASHVARSRWHPRGDCSPETCVHSANPPGSTARAAAVARGGLSTTPEVGRRTGLCARIASMRGCTRCAIRMASSASSFQRRCAIYSPSPTHRQSDTWLSGTHSAPYGGPRRCSWRSRVSRGCPFALGHNGSSIDCDRGMRHRSGIVGGWSEGDQEHKKR
ncbi:hypothetical protein V8D89_001236 [Ganoderma adspersum]